MHLAIDLEQSGFGSIISIVKSILREFMEEFIGKRIGRYQVIELLHQKDITAVYKAHDTKLERDVTLKIFAHSREYSKEFFDHFLQEAKSLARLSHKGIVQILDYGEYEGYAFIVMEFISDHSLTEKIIGAMDWIDAVNWLIPIAEALAYAHSNGVIHRDLNPDNILINSENEPVISDFSIAQIIESEETRDVTGTHVGLGSPEYMSPEQGRGLSIDYRADIYSLGILFYEMVTGQKPFRGENGMEVVIQQVTLIPSSPRKLVPSLPIHIEKIILTTLQKNPDDRYQSIEEFISTLQMALDARPQLTDRSPLKRTLRIEIASAVCILLIALLILSVSDVIPIKRTPSIPTNTSSFLTPEELSVTEVKTMEEIIQPTTVNNKNETQVDEKPSFERKLPQFPLTEGKTIPLSKVIISTDNVINLSEIARWGTPKINDVKWLADDSTVITATSIGIYYLGNSDLNIKGFFDARGWITLSSVSTDGKWIATGDRTGIIRIWDSYTGQEKYQFEGHSGEITSLQFSENGEKMVSGSSDGTIKIWDLVQGKELYLLKKHAYAINAAVMTYDGKYIVSGSDDFQLIVWDVETGEIVKQSPAGHKIKDIAVGHDNKTIVVALQNATIEIWDLENFNSSQVEVLRDPDQVEPFSSISLLPTDYFLAAGADDGWVRIWNLSNGKLDYELPPSSSQFKIMKEVDGIKDLTFSKDGNQLVSLTRAGKIIIWNYLNEISKITRDENWSSLRRVIFSADSKRLAVQNDLPHIEIWDSATGQRLDTYPGQILPGTSFSTNNNYIAAIEDNRVQIYDLDGPIHTISWPNQSLNYHISFSSDSKILAASNQRSLTLWSVNNGNELDPVLKIDRNCQTAYSEDLSFLASGSNVGIFFDEQVAKNLCGIAKPPYTISSDFSEDGKFLAFGLETKKIELWEDVNNFQERIELQDGNGKVMSVAFSPDGQLLATGNEDGKVRIWDMTSKQVVYILDHHTSSISGVAFSADGRRLASVSEDGSIEVWGIIQ